MNEKIFERVEKKYLIDESQYQAILQVVKSKMQPDRYHQSEIYNIYFDSDSYDLIIKSIDHPLFKQKLRARSYGGYDKVFLEIKTKLMGQANYEEHDNNLGFKRRVLITHKDYDKLTTHKKTVAELAQNNIETPHDVQIAEEIDYMINLFQLAPKILVYYNRESYQGADGLRVTFDTNLKYRNKTLKFHKNSRDRSLFQNDKCIIMEIKAHGYMPLWLVKILSSTHAYPTQFSKIGKAYENIIRKEQNV